MNVTVIILFVVGLVLLIVGAELLVRGASRLAAFLGIATLVIGLTVVAYGTSSPELAVSVQASLQGQADIALGNVVGSNIFNVLFILGLSAIITPLVVSRQLVRLDVPIMIFVSALAYVLGLNNKIGQSEGLFLFVLLVVYTLFLIRLSRKERKINSSAGIPASGNRTGKPILNWLINIGLVLVGLGLLVLGSRWLVAGAVAVAKVLGLSELIIALTIIAAGTSLPEVATSIIAAIRGERDIAVGNVVGSNIFNLLAVMGIASAISPQGVNVSPAAIYFDVPVMLAVAVACLPIFFTGHLIARWEGFLFLGYYIAYTSYLVLASTRHDALPMFSTVMKLFIIPLTVITLVTLAGRALHRERQARRLT